MKTIAIIMIAGATMMANHSFAQVRLGGGARLAAGASVSTPGISHAMRATTATVKSTSRVTVDAGKQAEAKTVTTADKTVNKVNQTEVKSSAKVQANVNVNGQAKASADVHAASAASAGKQ